MLAPNPKAKQRREYNPHLESDPRTCATQSCSVLQTSTDIKHEAFQLVELYLAGGSSIPGRRVRASHDMWPKNFAVQATVLGMFHWSQDRAALPYCVKREAVLQNQRKGPTS